MAEIAAQIITGSFTVGAATLTYLGALLKGHLDNSRQDRVRFRLEQLESASTLITTLTEVCAASVKYQFEKPTDEADNTARRQRYFDAITAAAPARDKVKLLFPPERRATLEPALQAAHFFDVDALGADAATLVMHRETYVHNFWAAINLYINEVREFIQVS